MTSPVPYHVVNPPLDYFEREAPMGRPLGRTVVVIFSVVLWGASLLGTNVSAALPPNLTRVEMRGNGTSNVPASVGRNLPSAAALVDELRTEFRLTVDDAGRLLNVSRRTVYNWLRGQPVRPDHLANLQNAVEVLRRVFGVAGIPRGQSRGTETASPVLEQIRLGNLAQAERIAGRARALSPHRAIGERPIGLFVTRRPVVRAAELRDLVDSGDSQEAPHLSGRLIAAWSLPKREVSSGL